MSLFQQSAMTKTAMTNPAMTKRSPESSMPMNIDWENLWLSGF